MDKKLDELIMMGSPVDKDQDLKGEVKEYYLGGKARYVFPCACCENQIITEGTYWSSDDYLRDSIRIEISYRLKNLIYRIIRPIPFVGRFLYDRAYRKVDEREDRRDEEKGNKAKYEAFEEVKDKFMKCTKCGTYSCIACFKDGLCGICNTFGDMESEVLGEYDKQLAEQEKMFAKLIEEQPENREMYLQQLEEAKKRIEDAKKEVAENMRKQD